MALQGLEVVADIYESCQHLGPAVGAVAITVDYLFGSSQLETTHFHEVVDEANLFDVPFLILADLRRTAGLRLQVGKLLLPVAQRTLVDAKHLCHLADGVVQFEVFV